MNSPQPKKTMPAQEQNKQPGSQKAMHPQPQTGEHTYLAAGKLKDRCAIITGGDSGIGRAVAVAFAKERADVLVAYLNEHDDARETERLVKENGRRCVLAHGDIADEAHARGVVKKALAAFGKIDILVNNAGEQHTARKLEEINSEQLEKTFKTNFFGLFLLTREALPHMRSGGSIVHTTSVPAYRGSLRLLDYSATKGALVAFTRSLSRGGNVWRRYANGKARST
jgi:NAD(P)-dependent dehydrogenase (short-subunit alcohol dehydrogenase family)